MHFDTYFCFCFSLILQIIPRASASSLLDNFLFHTILQFDILDQKYQIQYDRKLLFVSRYQMYLQFSVLFSYPGISNSKTVEG